MLTIDWLSNVEGVEMGLSTLYMIRFMGAYSLGQIKGLMPNGYLLSFPLPLKA
jgi:hypothetical protein